MKLAIKIRIKSYTRCGHDDASTEIICNFRCAKRLSTITIIYPLCRNVKPIKLNRTKVGNTFSLASEPELRADLTVSITFISDKKLGVIKNVGLAAIRNYLFSKDRSSYAWCRLRNLRCHMHKCKFSTPYYIIRLSSI